MKIGLTRTENPEKHQYYIDWLKGNDDIEIVTISADHSNPDDIKNFDALVLSGGADIYPEIYGGSLEYDHLPKKGWKRDRDFFEMSAFETALEQSIPVLGICRGLQLVNVVLKGTLVQDLGDEGLNPVHKGSPDKSHPVKVEINTLLHDIAKTETGEINSAHHQAIQKLGKGLQVNCTANDGTIEGIEWADKSGKPFLLCVQWHPERMFRFQLQDSPLSKNIRERFITEIKQSIQSANENH